MMTLYQIFNGENNTVFRLRVYVWAESKERAIELAGFRFKKATERNARYFAEESAGLNKEVDQWSAYYWQNATHFYDPVRFQIDTLFAADSPEFVSEVSDDDFEMPTEEAASEPTNEQ